MLRDYAASRHVPFSMCGKLIVATHDSEEASLATIQARAAANGVPLSLISRTEALALEPDLSCSAALLSPETGIIDSHALMLSLLGDAEAHGALLALRTPVLDADGTELSLGGDEPSRLKASQVVIAAGLSSPCLARLLGMTGIPEGHLCKGNYFALSGRAPFSRLIYPVPVPGGLGIHYTLDLGGQGRFGPDVQWIDEENYHVDASRRDAFTTAVRRYWPGCTAERLEPAYSGIRPKLCAQGDPDADFQIIRQENMIALLGIESPGLTSSLALAEEVRTLL